MRALPRTQDLGRPGERAMRRHEDLRDAGRRGAAQDRANVARDPAGLRAAGRNSRGAPAWARRGTTASTATPTGSCASSAQVDSGTVSVRDGGTRGKQRAQCGIGDGIDDDHGFGWAVALEVHAITSASPSSTQSPDLRRSRDDAIRRAACFRRGLSKKLMRGMAVCGNAFSPTRRARRDQRAGDPSR